jgi:hypothetical protein
MQTWDLGEYPDGAQTYFVCSSQKTLVAHQHRASSLHPKRIRMPLYWGKPGLYQTLPLGLFHVARTKITNMITIVEWWSLRGSDGEFSRSPRSSLSKIINYLSTFHTITANPAITIKANRVGRVKACRVFRTECRPKNHSSQRRLRRYSPYVWLGYQFI